MFFLILPPRSAATYIERCVLWGCNNEKSVREMDVGFRVPLTVGITRKIATTVCTVFGLRILQGLAENSRNRSYLTYWRCIDKKGDRGDLEEELGGGG